MPEASCHLRALRGPAAAAAVGCCRCRRCLLPARRGLGFCASSETADQAAPALREGVLRAPPAGSAAAQPTLFAERDDWRRAEPLPPVAACTGEDCLVDATVVALAELNMRRRMRRELAGAAA